MHQVEDQRYDLLGQWLTADLDRFFLVTLDALAMADDVARGDPPFEEWSSENYAVSFTPSALLITNLWVPGAEGEFPADVARAAIEDYWRFLVAQPERSAVREYRPDLPKWQADLLRWEEKRAATTRTGGDSSDTGKPFANDRCGATPDVRAGRINRGRVPDRLDRERTRGSACPAVTADARPPVGGGVGCPARSVGSGGGHQPGRRLHR